MNENRIRKLLKMAELRVNRKEPIKDVLRDMVQAAYGDPFAVELDEFMKEKEKGKEENPQDNLEEKLEDEGAELPGIEEVSPQDKLEKKLDKSGNELPGIEEVSPQEKFEDKEEKVEERLEKQVESQLIALASSLMSRNQVRFAKKILAQSGIDVVGMLNNLLKSEYLQRDLYQAYDYLLLGPAGISVQEHLREHLDEEMNHIRILQRYLTGMGEVPTLERLEVPSFKPVSLKKILEADLEWELKAIADYTLTLQKLDEVPEFRALVVDIENILIQEMEHAQDIQRWLKEL
jgi:bacterioferritin (cytochrome b1)